MRAMRRFALIVIALVVGAGACGDNEPLGTRRLDPAIQAIVDAGFREDMIIDAGSYYLVEGDISFPKSYFRNPTGPAPLFQWRTLNVVGSSAVEHITVNLTGFETSWANAMRAAMTEWNNPSILSKVVFIEGSPGDITTSMQDLGGNCTAGTVAIADFPTSGGAAGPTIRANPTFTSCYTAGQKKFAMAHELGHAIAFRHTDWQARNEYEVPYGAVQIGPATDPNSIMNGNGAFQRAWAGFSMWDRLAVRDLYPYPIPEAFTATMDYSGQAVVSFSPVANGPTDYRVRLTVYGWQVSNGEQYGFGYEEFSSPWVSSTSVTLTGYSYTGTSSCNDGDPWVDGSWYKEYSMWLDFRYADGSWHERPFVEAPLVMVC